MLRQLQFFFFPSNFDSNLCFSYSSLSLAAKQHLSQSIVFDPQPLSQLTSQPFGFPVHKQFLNSIKMAISNTFRLALTTKNILKSIAVDAISTFLNLLRSKKD